jgi:hypothetical protein
MASFWYTSKETQFDVFFFNTGQFRLNKYPVFDFGNVRRWQPLSGKRAGVDRPTGKFMQEIINFVSN